MIYLLIVGQPCGRAGCKNCHGAQSATEMAERLLDRMDDSTDDVTDDSAVVVTARWDWLTADQRNAGGAQEV